MVRPEQPKGTLDLQLDRDGNLSTLIQAAGNRGRLGPASDVFSLGAVLYHMLTGRPPFQAATAVDTVLSVLEQDPLPPRLLNPRADRDLEMIALKCLQKPPDLRYASADRTTAIVSTPPRWAKYSDPASAAVSPPSEVVHPASSRRTSEALMRRAVRDLNA